MLDILTQYMKAGIKDTVKKELGVEVEHFIVDRKTKKAFSYYGEKGVRHILLELMKKHPEAKEISGEDILGFSTPVFTITLEPAAQMEISIIQTEKIEEIKVIYSDFFTDLDQIVTPLGGEIITKGCQPESHVDELELIPKERYRLMDDHFRKTGTGGRQMMRGTASTQISVDYTSEEDFRKKLQAAYFYTPLFKMVTDRIKKFQGEDVMIRLFRNDIWCRTDPRRCGILPDIFKKDYGFIDYAEYLCSSPLIVLPGENGENYTDKTACEAYEGRKPEKTDIEHIFSMVFPDVRVKKYIEIRGADSMPADGVYAYCALIKGLIYSEKVLDHVQEFIASANLKDEDIRMSEKSLSEKGWNGEIYGIDAVEFLKTALDKCRDGLTAGDIGYLEAWDWFE